VGLRLAAEQFEDLGVALGVISQGVPTTGEMQLQRELGNVEAGIQDVDIVLTQTCRIRATMIGVVVRKQRFEFGTMGARGTSFVTHHARAYADAARSHAHHCLPACRPEGNSSLTASLKTAKQDISEDTSCRADGAENLSCGSWLKLTPSLCPRLPENFLRLQFVSITRKRLHGISKQTPVVAFRVQDAEHNHAVAFDAVENLVGKAAREQTAKTVVINRATFRVRGETLNGQTDYIKQFSAKSGALIVIPFAGVL
jgi:hypothetical protein